MKTYHGIRTTDGCVVTVDGNPLPLRLDLRNHSPTGFEWGYMGSGPSQLAVAILADAYGEAFAVTHYQTFKQRVIALMSEDSFRLELDDADSTWVAGGCLSVREAAKEMGHDSDFVPL